MMPNDGEEKRNGSVAVNTAGIVSMLKALIGVGSTKMTRNSMWMDGHADEARGREREKILTNTLVLKKEKGTHLTGIGPFWSPLPASFMTSRGTCNDLARDVSASPRVKSIHTGKKTPGGAGSRDTHETHGTRGRTKAHRPHRRTSQPSKPVHVDTTGIPSSCYSHDAQRPGAQPLSTREVS